MGTKYYESNSIFAFSPRQTNYVTLPVPDDDPKNFRWVWKQGYAKAAFSSPNIPNEGESTGLPQPDETFKGEDTTSFEASEQLTYQLAAIRFADAFGVVASTTVVATKAWTHAISLLDPFSGANLPTRALAMKVGEPASAANKILDALLPSMMMNTVSVTNEGGAERPGLTLNSTWLGSGEFKEDYAEVLGSGVKFYNENRHVWNKSDISAAHNTKINKKSADITIFPQANYAGTSVTTECILGDFSLGMDNQLQANYNCGRYQDNDGEKGSIAGSTESAGQRVTFDLSAIADSDFVQTLDLYERIKTGAPFSVKIAFKGAAIATTTPITVTVDTGGAAQGAETIPVTALPGAIAKNAVLTFTGGKKARLTAQAASGATSVTVEPLAAALVATDAATYDYHHNLVFNLPKVSIADHGWDAVLGRQGLRITSAPLADGSTPALSVDITTNVENPATYIAA